MGLLEEGLSDVGHNLLILSNLRWNTHKCTEFWWQINILSFLSDFKKWLINRVYFYRVSRQEIVDHIGPGLLVSVVEDVVFGIHVPLDLMDLVGSVWSVLSHDDGSLELSVDEIIIVALKSVLD